MINLSNLTVNVPRANIEDYAFTIYGRPKAGKTSMFAKLVETVYGDINKGLLLAFEPGFNALRVVAQSIDDFTDYLDAVDQLVDEKDSLPFKIIGIDTADVMYSQAVVYVLKRESRRDGKKYLAINDIPWGKGYELVEKEISESLMRLKRAGYGLVFISHDIDKKFESRDGVSYDKTTCSLPTRMRNSILNLSDFICFIDIAKEKGLDGSLEDKRYIYFRGDGADLEAGSRFANVPQKIEYDIDLFVETFENAVKSEFDTSVDLSKVKKQQLKEKEEKAKQFVESEKVPTNDELVDVIKSLYSKVTPERRAEMQTVLDRNNVKTLTEPNNIDKDVLLEIVALLKGE